MSAVKRSENLGCQVKWWALSPPPRIGLTDLPKSRGHGTMLISHLTFAVLNIIFVVMLASEILILVPHFFFEIEVFQDLKVKVYI